MSQLLSSVIGIVLLCTQSYSTTSPPPSTAECPVDTLPDAWWDDLIYCASVIWQGPPVTVDDLYSCLNLLPTSLSDSAIPVKDPSLMVEFNNGTNMTDCATVCIYGVHTLLYTLFNDDYFAPRATCGGDIWTNTSLGAFDNTDLVHGLDYCIANKAAAFAAFSDCAFVVTTTTSGAQAFYRSSIGLFVMLMASTIVLVSG